MRTKTNIMKEFLSLSPEVTAALADNKPILALESTVITHGLPYPTNLEVALQLEQRAKDEGAVPATIAILNGKCKIGLTADEMTQLADGKASKASCRDLAYMVSKTLSAGTTVALTAMLAHHAGISVFATGGIGGVHYGDSLDISADLYEISQTPIAIISAGPKAILDTARTLEVLETYSVPVIAYQTNCIPAFYSRHSAHKAPLTADTLAELTACIKTHRDLALPSGILVMNPIPVQDEIPASSIEPSIQTALAKAEALNIKGKEITPFLLAELTTLTKGKSLQANIALLNNNVTLGAKLARSLIT